MKLSDLKGEAALDALADMLEPAAEIMTDADFVSLLRKNERLKAVQLLLKKHQKSVIEIMAATEGKTADEYEVNILTLPKKLVEVFNDPEVVSLFQLQSQKKDENFSGSAMENTKVEEK